MNPPFPLYFGIDNIDFFRLEQVCSIEEFWVLVVCQIHRKHRMYGLRHIATKLRKDQHA